MEINSGTKQILFFILEECKLMIFLTLIFFLYFYYTSTFDHFKNKGVKYLKPVIFFGNLWPRLVAKESFNEFQLNIYNYFKGDRYGGIFEGRTPLLYIVDPDLIKAVTIRDFDHFVNRITLSTNEPRYIQRFILNLKGSEWKSVRSIITPAFSSFRLKNMFPIMQESSKKLLMYLDKIDCSEVEMKKLMGYYTLDGIGTCAFGIDSCFYKNENSEFIKAAENFNAMSLLKRMTFLLMLVFMPGMFKYINFSFLNQESLQILMAILQKAKAERRSSNVTRSDFLQILIDAAMKEQEENKGPIELDDDTIDAQALIFLLAGYETSSTVLSFAIYVLTTQPDIQDKLRQDINDVTKGEDLTYEHMADLDYLEGVLLETCRMYPPFARVDRVCVKPYTLPGTSVRIDAGDRVAVPVPGVHMDPDLYPDPDRFIPERFTRDERKKRPGHHFLGFGSGPRNCIGMRFSMISMKLAMVVLLRNYRFVPCSRTEVPLQFAKKAMILKTVNGIWVKMEKI